jgi:hypothetical protein
MYDRRELLGLVGTVLATLGLSRTSQAGLARAVPLADLVKRSLHVLRGMPLDARAEWATIGTQRRIVTYTRVRFDELFTGLEPKDSELMVRTLGGHVGDIGQIVHGEAMLRVNEACVLFLRKDDADFEQVAEMAQGHYPIRADAAGATRLFVSPYLSALTGAADSAVQRLVGRRLEEARELIRGAGR